MPDFWPPITSSCPSLAVKSMVAAPKSKSGPPSGGQLWSFSVSQAVFQTSLTVAWNTQFTAPSSRSMAKMASLVRVAGEDMFSPVAT